MDCAAPVVVVAAAAAVCRCVLVWGACLVVANLVSFVCHSFFTRSSAKLAAPIAKLLEDAKQVVPPELRSMSSYGGKRRGALPVLRMLFR